MIRFSSNALWSDIEALAINATIKQAAVAYVTDESRIEFGKGDTLIVDASDKAIATGQTKAEVIGRAFKRGANIYSFPNLHAKVMLFDNTAVIGSTNISTFSAKTLKEASVITDHIDIVASASAFISQLKKDERAQQVDNAFVSRISSIPVSTTSFDPSNISLNGDNKKITLFESLTHQNKQLNDFIISFWEGELELTETEVKKAAKHHGLALPPEKRWERFEYYNSGAGLDSFIKRILLEKGKKVISFQIQTEEEKIKKFISLDGHVLIYVNHFSIKNFVVVNFIKDQQSPFKLKSGKELCQNLSHGLRERPRLAKTLYNKPDWFCTPKEIAKLLAKQHG